MNNQLYILKNNLSDDDKKFLMSIYEPRVVVIPPSNACQNICVTPEGEIRIYGSVGKKRHTDPGTLVYISSTDCGLSWKQHFAKPGCLGSAGFNPETGRYITHYPNTEYRPDYRMIFDESGTWAILNDEGFDSCNHRYVKLTDKSIHILKQPFYLKSRKRWFIIGEYRYPDFTDKVVVLYHSDDDGENWTEKIVTPSAPKFETVPPHKGSRWQEYSCEPTIVELSNGELVMYVRTSQNYHYCYKSSDGGSTWSLPEQTNFHGTITMPVLHKLSDGRIVFFWCNTQPLPELNHDEAFPPLGNDEKTGIWEDVFTNRDVNHLAISDDDMKTWKGFREIFINNLRNYADFRSIGGLDSQDKSVHQGQILELPYNKLMIHFGQNEVLRKVVILDIDWLYQQGRSEDFRNGLSNVSTHMYVKSNLGGFRGFSGHCAYNRTNGALLIPDPAGNFEEVLQICRTEDPRLVYQKQGAVWNFPTSEKGRVEIKLSVKGSGVRICLTDHWYNPVDETVADEAHASIEVSKKCDWTVVSIDYDTEQGKVTYTVGDEVVHGEINACAPNGLSYLHIQSLAEEQDFEGTIIKYLKQE